MPGRVNISVPYSFLGEMYCISKPAARKCYHALTSHISTVLASDADNSTPSQGGEKQGASASIQLSFSALSSLFSSRPVSQFVSPSVHQHWQSLMY